MYICLIFSDYFWSQRCKYPQKNLRSIFTPVCRYLNKHRLFPARIFHP